MAVYNSFINEKSRLIDAFGAGEQRTYLTILRKIISVIFTTDTSVIWPLIQQYLSILFNPFGFCTFSNVGTGSWIGPEKYLQFRLIVGSPILKVFLNVLFGNPIQLISLCLFKSPRPLFCKSKSNRQTEMREKYSNF